jgi:uncharacterized protein YdaU (DUF1376 family)
MSKDPAFLFYPGDWLGGTMLLSRHHKGAYMDILMAQFNNGRMSEKQIKILLGKEDEDLWEEVLKCKFKQDSDGLFYNERLEIEAIKRAEFTASRRRNLKKEELHTPSHMASHMENENEDINEDLIVVNNKPHLKKINKHDYIDDIDDIIDVYIKADPDYKVINKQKDRACASKILNLYKKKYPISTSEETLSGLYAYFRSCVAIDDKWLHDNMSLSIIISQFNKINKILKNEKPKSGGVTDRELAEIVAKHFGD